jgi:hypothetical protein
MKQFLHFIRKFALSFPHGNFKSGVTFNYVQLGEFFSHSLKSELLHRPARQAGRGLDASRSFSPRTRLRSHQGNDEPFCEKLTKIAGAGPAIICLYHFALCS